MPSKWNPNIRFDHDNDGLVKNNQGNLIDVNPQPRYHFAKQLYILLTKLVDGARIDVDGDGEAESIETAFLLAQWAVNVVDFRDPDAIMTPFEFDTNPLTSWDVDGRIDPNSLDNNHPESLKPIIRIYPGYESIRTFLRNLDRLPPPRL